ncbi:MAG: right-handed parallel beta-helix repeat-containing protein [Candidatus Nanoarchaeia archaeon]
MINNFYYGVYFHGATNGTIQNVSASTTHALGRGMWIRGDSNTIMESTSYSYYYLGFYISDADYNIFDNLNGSTALGYGFWASNSTNNIFRNSFASNTDTANNSFRLELGSNDNFFSNMTVVATGTNGGCFLVYTGSVRNSFYNSSFISSSGYAVYVYTNNNTFDNCTFIGVTGVVITNNTGNYYNNITNSYIYPNLYIRNSSNNYFVNNVINSSWFVVRMNESAYQNNDDNYFINNTFITTSATVPYIVGLGSLSSGNVFYLNNFSVPSGFSGKYIHDYNGSNYYYTVINGTQQGNAWPEVLNGSLSIRGEIASSVYPGLYYGITGADYPYDNASSVGRLYCPYGCTDYGPLINNSNDGPSNPTVSITSTSGYNLYGDNLTASISGSTDPEGDDVYNITDWRVEGTSRAVLNMPFDTRGSGDTGGVRDYSTYSNNGTLGDGTASTVPNWTSGSNCKVGGCYSFDSDDDTITISGLDIDASTENYTTVLFWMYWDGAVNEMPFGFTSYDIYATASCFGFNTGNSDVLGISNSGLSGRWVHVAAIFHNGVVNSTYNKIYINGTAQVITTCLGTSHNNRSASTTAKISGWASNTLYKFGGEIDELMIFNYDLSPAQIQEVYNAGLAGHGLEKIVSNEIASGGNWTVAVTSTDLYEESTEVASSAAYVRSNVAPVISAVVLNASTINNYTSNNLTVYVAASDENGQPIYNITDWRLNGTSIAVLNMPFDTDYFATTADGLKDYSTFGNNGTLGGGTSSAVPTWTSGSDCKVGGCYDFDGNDNYISGKNMTINPAGFTMSAWVKLESFSSQKFDYPGIVTFVSYNDSIRPPYIYFDNVTSSFKFAWRNSSFSSTSFSVESSTGVWVHLAGVFNGTHLITYRNGTLINSVQNSSNVPSVSTQLRIGTFTDYHYLNGSIDEVMIFNRSLSSAQIQELYNAGVAGKHLETVVRDETTSGDAWSVNVVSTDLVNDSSAVLSSNLTIRNTPPPAPIHATPTNAGRVIGNSQTVTWTPTGTDDDGDTITYYWRIDTDNPPSGGFTCNGSSITSSSSACTTVDGTTYYWNIITGDVYENLSATTAWSFRENTKPSVDLSISPSIGLTSADLNCTVSSWSDAEADNAQYYFQWYNGSTLKFTTGSTTNTSDILGKGNLTAGDVWNCTVTPYDGYENGSSVTISKTIYPDCGTLSEADTMYALGSNISISDSSCFNVTAANVVIDCNGFTISGNNAAETYGVYSNQANTTLKNCIISGFYYDAGFIDAARPNVTNVSFRTPVGLLVNGTSDGTYADLSFTNITTYGIRVVNNSHRNTFAGINLNTSGSGQGIYVDGGENNSFDCNGGVIYGTNTSATYGLYSSQFNTIIKNCIIDNFNTNAYYNGSADFIVYNNTLSTTFTDGAGIYATSSSHRGNISLNTINATGSGSDGVYVSSGGGDNITVDCLGTYIFGNNASGSYGVYSADVGLLVKNCVINNFNSGIGTIGSADSVIYNNSISCSYTNGFGISLGASSHRANISLNEVNASGSGSDAIFVNMGGGDNITVDCMGKILVGSNTSGSNGVYSRDVNISIMNCIVNEFSAGFFIFNDQYATIYNNSFSSSYNQSYGVYLLLAHRANILGNTINITGDGASIGLSLSGYNVNVDCLGRTITGNNAAGSVGVFVSNDNESVSNCVISNFDYAFNITGTNGSIFNNTLLPDAEKTKNLVYLSETASVNKIYLNNFTETSGYYVVDNNGSNSYNYTINSTNNEGNMWYNVLGGDVDVYGLNSSVISGLYMGFAGPGYPYSNTTSDGKMSCISGCIDYAPLTYKLPINCSELSSANTVYAMYYNATIDGATCFNVTAANVTLDCNGYSIIGNNTTATYGVYSNQFNTAIENCVINNFSSDIFLSTADESVVYNNTLSTSFAGGNGAGIWVDFSQGVNISSNTINVSGSGGTGVWLDKSNNVIVDCMGSRVIGINTSSSYGIYPYDSNSTMIKNCIISDFSHNIILVNVLDAIVYNNTLSTTFSNGYGILGSTNSHRGNFSLNTINVSGSSADGIYFQGGAGDNVTVDCMGASIIGSNTSNIYGVYSANFNTTIKNCNINKFSSGVYFTGSTNGLIYNTTINTSLNGGTAITLTSASNSNNITLLNINNGNASGVYIDGGTSNVVDCSGGTLNGGNVSGIQGIYSSQNNTKIMNCKINKFYNGILLNGSNYGNISKSNISISAATSGTRPTGIYLYGSNDSVINKVDSTNTNGPAVFLTLSNRNTLSEINVSSTYNQIYLYASSNNTASDINASGSGSGMYVETGSNYNNISNFYAMSTSSYGVALISNNNNRLSRIFVRTSYSFGGAIHFAYENASSVSICNVTSSAYRAIQFSPSASNNINISNCVLSGSAGLLIWDGSAGVIADNITAVGFSEAVYLNTGTTSFTLKNSIIRSSGSGVGVYVAGTSADIINTTVWGGTGAYGISVNSGTTKIINSSVRSNTAVGIYVGSASTNINVNGTSVYSNTSHGIRVAGANAVIDCEGRTIIGNNSANTYGIYSTSTGATIKGCEINNFSRNLYFTDDNNNIYNNTFINPSAVAHVWLGASANSNTFYWNNFTTTSGYYVDDDDGANYYNTTISGNGEGNLWENVLDGTVSIAGSVASSIPGFYIGSSGSGYPYSGSNSGGKLSGTIIDYAPLTNRSNTAPVMVSASVLPDPAYTNDTLQGYCNATDIDGGTVLYYYQWYKNGDANESGTTSNIFTQGILSNMDNLSSGIQNKGETWILGCKASDGTGNSSWVNSSTLTISNLPPPKVTLSYPTNGDFAFTNRTPRFNWTTVTDIDPGDSVLYHIFVATNEDMSGPEIVNETGLSDNYYDYVSELDFDTYYWHVRAYDGTEYGEWSDTWNFTVEPSVSIELLTPTVDFGSMNPADTDDTTDDSPGPFVFRSLSNTYIDLYDTNVSTGIWSTVTLNTSYWQIKARSTIPPNDGTFNESGSLMTWVNVSNSVDELIRRLNYSGTENEISVDIGITVPSYEPPTVKTSNISFYWEEAQ